MSGKTDEIQSSHRVRGTLNRAMIRTLRSVVFGICAVAAQVHAQTITIDASIKHQVMDGWINQLRVWDDPHLTETFRPPRGTEDAGRSAVNIPLSAQSEILELLYGDLGLTHVQAVIERGAQPVEGGPFNFNWKRSDAQIAYVKQARPHGLAKTIFWVLNGETWLQNRTDPNGQAAWEMALLRRWRSMGVEPEYLMVWNEPGYNGAWATPEYIRELIRAMGRRLKAEGFSTRIVAPETLTAGDGLRYLETIFADPEVRGYVAAISTHLYGEGGNLKNLVAIRDRYARPYKKPLWMSEYSEISDAFDFAQLMSNLLSNDVSNIGYEWGFFGQWQSRAHLITINHSPPGNTYTGYTRTKIYHTFGQFSRFIRAGDRRISAVSSDDVLRVTAFQSSTGGSIILVNNSRQTYYDVTFKLVALSEISSVRGFRTSPNENWAILSEIPVLNGGFRAALPARSVTTYTWRTSPKAVEGRVDGDPGTARRDAPDGAMPGKTNDEQTPD